MGGRGVTARTGERWQVRMVWAPRLWDDTVGIRTRHRWRRYRRRLHIARDHGGVRRHLATLFDFGDELVLAVVAAVAVVVLVVLFLLVFALPLLIEVIVLVAVTVLGAAAKVLLRRPWTVAAESDDGTRITWSVVGWRASRQHADAVATALEHGLPLPRGGTPLRASGRGPAGNDVTTAGSA